jgi:hypothetical protein
MKQMAGTRPEPRQKRANTVPAFSVAARIAIDRGRAHCSEILELDKVIRSTSQSRLGGVETQRSEELGLALIAW